MTDPPGGLSAHTTVVVADGQPLFREGVLRALGTLARLPVVGVARDADELSEAADVEPDVALVALDLPGLQDADLASFCRAHPRVAVVVVAAADDVDAVARAFEAGAHGLLVRTASREELVRTIRAVARGETVVPFAAQVALAGEDERSARDAPRRRIPLRTRHEPDGRVVTGNGSRQLLRESLAAELRERRRLASEIHDDALQVLLAARQDLEEGRDGNHDALVAAADELAEGTRLLREIVRDLQPPEDVPRHLRASLERLCERHAHRGRFTTELVVGEGAEGIADELVLSLARELVANATKHASASHVRVSVRRLRGRLALEVADDGRGIDPERAEGATSAGHFGIATVRDRTEAAGGAIDIRSAPGEGTTVRVELPVAEP